MREIQTTDMKHAERKTMRTHTISHDAFFIGLRSVDLFTHILLILDKISSSFTQFEYVQFLRWHFFRYIINNNNSVQLGKTTNTKKKRNEYCLWSVFVYAEYVLAALSHRNVQAASLTHAYFLRAEERNSTEYYLCD